MRWTHRASCLLLTCLLSAPALAETVRVDSVDVRVTSADLVVVGTIVESQVLPYRTGGGWRWTLATVAVEETLRGPEGRSRRVIYRGGLGALPWDTPGTRVVAFLVRPERFEASPPASAPSDVWVAAPGQSSITDRAVGALVLDPKAPPVVSADFRVLRHPETILPAVRAAAERARDAPDEGITVEPPRDSEAWKLLYAGSAVSVRVPTPR